MKIILSGFRTVPPFFIGKGHPIFYQAVPEERVRGSCLLSQMVPLQLVAKVPGKELPIVVWDNKVIIV